MWRLGRPSFVCVCVCVGKQTAVRSRIPPVVGQQRPGTHPGDICTLSEDGVTRRELRQEKGYLLPLPE